MTLYCLRVFEIKFDIALLDLDILQSSIGWRIWEDSQWVDLKKWGIIWDGVFDFYLVFGGYFDGVFEMVIDVADEFADTWSCNAAIFALIITLNQATWWTAVTIYRIAIVTL